MLNSTPARIAALALSLFGANLGIAEAATQTIAIRAFVPGFCAVAGHPASVSFAVAIPVDAKGKIDAAAQSFTAHSVVCNATAGMKVGSSLGGAVNAAAAASGSKVNYVVSAGFAGATATLDTATSGGRSAAASTSHPARGDLIVTLTPIQPASPLAPSSVYTDTVTVQFVPN